MNLLLLVPSYPHPEAQWAGAHNERSALELSRIVQHLRVIAPTPYAPRLLSFNERWRGYARAPKDDVRQGIAVHRPAYPVIPRLFQAFWPATAAFLSCRTLVKRLDAQIGFDAILSFDLQGVGGLAWRLGRELGVPACGWATGTDIRWNARTAVGRSVQETLGKLDLVFYQTAELKALAAELLGTTSEAPPFDARHIVLPRGVGQPEGVMVEGARRLARSKLGLDDGNVVILYLGRIVEEKGLFGLVDVLAKSCAARRNVSVVLVGSRPGYDESRQLEKVIESRRLSRQIRILPGCDHSQIWDYFSAADIFAFPSFREGMPNSLLEAMLAGVPSVAFAIPSIREITRFGNGVIEVPPYDFELFGEALLTLADDPKLRKQTGESGKAIVREHFSVHRSMRAAIDHIERVVHRD